MPDNLSDIAAYYNSDPRREHLRLEHHQLELELTWRFLEDHLPPPGAAILEVGAATGRYTLELARRGYRVTAVDLSAELLEENRRTVSAAGLAERVSFLTADARDLGAVGGGPFDAVLLMGPLYHLGEETDRLAALREAHARLREGGVLFSALISRFGVLSDLIKDMPAWIEDQARAHSLLASGRRPSDAAPGGFRGYFARVEEIIPLHAAAGFDALALAGVEPVIGADDASYNLLEGQQRRLWLELLYQISREPAILGASRHLLYVGRKGSAV